MRAARPSLLPGRVAWCAALPDGTCCAVVHFDKPLRFADVQDIAGLPPPRFAGRGAADVRYALVIGPAVAGRFYLPGGPAARTIPAWTTA